MGGTKNLSTYIVNQCQRNPRLAFLLIPLGAGLVYWGVTDAKFYQSLSSKPTRQMKVDRVYDAPHSRGFSAPHVAGQTPQGEVIFPISARAAREIQVGEDLAFVEANDSTTPYVTRKTLDGQLSGIRFSVAGSPINDIALLGSAICLGAIGWGLFGKPKRTEDEVSSSNKTESGPGKSH